VSASKSRTHFASCGVPAPAELRRHYPNGKQRPVDKCNRSQGHERLGVEGCEEHRVTEGKTFRVIVRWGGVHV
jgi:hypothetical protein